MQSIIIIPLVFANLAYSIKRFNRHPSGSLLNPLFYINILSCFYLVVPLTFISYTLTIVGWNIPTKVIQQCHLLSLWYFSVFFAFYYTSKDRDVRFSNILLSKGTNKCAKYLNIFICIILLYIVIFKVPYILNVRADRESAYKLYQLAIESPFKLRLIMFIHFGVLLAIYVNQRRIRIFTPLLLYLLIDFSHGGRIASVMVALFFYIIIVIEKQRSFVKYAICGAALLICLGIFQRDSSEFNLIWKLYSGAMEFSNTYLTTIYACEHPEIQYDVSGYIIWILSKLTPGGIIGAMAGVQSWYGDSLSEHIDIGFGLGGNIITESLIYGGFYFAMINPVLIAAFCYYVNLMKGKYTFSGTLLVLFLCLPMQENFRQYFWGYIFYPIQLTYFWGIWSFPDWHTKILSSIHTNSYSKLRML